MDEESVDYVSRRDATVACLVSAMLGAVLTAVVLIGSDIPLKCVEAGNAADWLAAAGTWVIGYGAWKYARVGHAQRIHEYRESEMRRIQDASIRASALLENATVVATLADGLKKISVKDADGGRGDAMSACRVGLAVLDNINWRPEDVTLLSERGLLSYGALTRAITQMKDAMKRSYAILEVKNPVALETIPLLVDVGATTEKRAESFAKEVGQTIAQLGKERSRVSLAMSKAAD